MSTITVYASDGQTILSQETIPDPPRTPQQQAQAQVAQLAAAVPDQIAQAQADAQTINAITPGAPLTAEQVAALGRHANGWPELLQGVLTLAQAAGLV